MCLMGLMLQAATLAVQKAEEEGIQVQSLPGCGRRSLPGPCLENLPQNKTQRLQATPELLPSGMQILALFKSQEHSTE